MAGTSTWFTPNSLVLLLVSVAVPVSLVVPGV